ncbi:MAG: hydroxymethylglutaryl-CoA lyase [Bacteroidetes bacterium]|nr:MAG: hydroxymethylglutaryl-CoA lyase [Bacteroidota bacterium]TAF94073.1 MAG: hydroxymethylglutaryl-CoA lyase [Bacteroidota bacterium]
MPPLQLVECPRDAMQGWATPIPTATKVAYIQQLLNVGFHTIDFGSYVSAKAIPQMADTQEVLNQLDVSNTATKLLAIVANERGAIEATAQEKISYLGFPFSVSPTFQLRNTNSTQQQSVERVEAIQELCVKNHKQLVVYLSMGFGNPYADEYCTAILLHWAQTMVQLGVQTISLADTVGIATPEQIETALTTLTQAYPSIQWGVHLHATATNWQPKLMAAFNSGCTRFDAALLGIGGCPMAQDHLVGNVDTHWVLQYLRQNSLLPSQFNEAAYQQALHMASSIFQA